MDGHGQAIDLDHALFNFVGTTQRKTILEIRSVVRAPSLCIGRMGLDFRI
jgi:hypothetical protein